ncbi:OsmC family peroxiredoxin [Nonlabens dokdonensis]|uniref:OsmC family peroxiredoxin n=1 Tax=Nonlabens dokdonensis TaxID=328515 RepID=A0A1Z8AQE1_9FLAO|nr:OsmC family protein [Nonlabens dokdonensis]OUS12544.1 OsmC family peroxiredoxin [Nonlabens dokdonensis]
MKFSRNANAQWQGTGKEGKGNITTQSTVLDKTPYAFGTRFEEEKGTNPEELIGAAHAGCYTMQLSFLLNEEGYTATHLSTDAKVTFDDGTITQVDLTLTADVPEISKEKLNEVANKAKEICPVSKLLKAEITLVIK